MGDFEAMIQDFSYLKSLELRGMAPKKLSKKLRLRHPRYDCIAPVLLLLCNNAY